MIPCGCWDGDGDGTEGRQHQSGEAMSTEQVMELQEREWEWERRTATEREWPELRLCRRRHPNNRRVSFSHLISSMWFLGCVLVEMEQLIFCFLCSFFFFFLGVMLSWDFLSRNEHSQFYWNRFLYIEIDFNKLGFYTQKLSLLNSISMYRNWVQ